MTPKSITPIQDPSFDDANYYCLLNLVENQASQSDCIITSVKQLNRLRDEQEPVIKSITGVQNISFSIRGYTTEYGHNEYVHIYG